MKITVEQEILAEVLQEPLRAATGRSPLPVLSGVRLRASDDSIEVAGTDLEVFVTTHGPAHVDEPGAVVVFGRMLGEITRHLPPGPATVSADAGRLSIRSGHVEFSLASLPTEDFPAVPGAVPGPTCRLAAGDLAQALGMVVPAASTDLGRAVLTGVLWSLHGETLRLVATDSYRLAVVETVVKEGPGVGERIVPARALGALARILGRTAPDALVGVTMGEHQIVLEAGSTRIVARLVEGTYPDWRRLIPEAAPNELVVGRTTLRSALDRVGLLAKATIPVRLDLGETLAVSARASGVGEATEAMDVVRYDGEPMSVGFNPGFLAAALDALNGDEVRLAFVDPGRPVVVTGEGAAVTYLVMPVRLNPTVPPPPPRR